MSSGQHHNETEYGPEYRVIIVNSILNGLHRLF
jgi:hypothetical protein